MNPANPSQPTEPVPEIFLASIVEEGRSLRDAEERRQFSHYITIREFLGLTTLVAICCAFFLSFREDGVLLVAMILAGNALGVAVGLMVTHVGGLPTDGSFDVPEDDDAYEKKGLPEIGSL